MTSVRLSVPPDAGLRRAWLAVMCLCVCQCLLFGGNDTAAAQPAEKSTGQPSDQHRPDETGKSEPRMEQMQPGMMPVPKPAPAVTAGSPPAEGPAMTMESFLDRLMMAESGGRIDARNPRSTALGPFQFIESTFLALARRHFAAETAAMTTQQVLALRTDMAFARKAAEAYTHENAAVLQSLGLPSSYPNLRLAYLLGPNGAAKVLKAPPDLPLSAVLPPAVLVANPFMSWLTARGLAQRAAREVSQPVMTSQGVDVPPGSAQPRRNLPPGIAVRCNLRLPSCKRWLSLRSVKAARQQIKVASNGATRTPMPKGLTTQAARPPSVLAATGRRGGRPSPTMEAAARGIPLSASPVGRSSLQKAAASRKAPAKKRKR